MRVFRIPKAAGTRIAAVCSIAAVCFVGPDPARALERRNLGGLAAIAVDGSTCTLADAIRAANAGTTVGGCTGTPGLDLVRLDADVVLATADTAHSSSVNGAYAGLPDVTSEIALVAGGGTTIERNASLGCDPADPDSFRLLNVLAGGELYLFDLTLRGGCVAPASGELAFGGAVLVLEGLLELSGVTAEDNAAVALGSVALGGALAAVSAQVPSIVWSMVRGNRARGVAFEGTEAAAFGGGAAIFQSASGPIVDTSFLENVAEGSSDAAGSGAGGGLALLETTSDELVRVTFEDNAAIGGSSTLGPGASASAGGLSIDATNLVLLTGCTFRGNSAIGGSSTVGAGGSGSGGAISLAEESTLGVIASSFENNRAEGGDAGAAETPGDGVGGAIFAVGEIEEIRNAYFGANVAVAGISPEIVLGAEARGGAIGTGSLLTTVERSAFVANAALGGTGTSGSRGGAIGGLDDIRVVNSSFDGNRAVGAETPGSQPGGPGVGGAIFGDGATRVRASTFSRNEARGGADGDGAGDGRGGALWVPSTASASAEIVGALFDDNVTGSGDDPAVPGDCWNVMGTFTSLGYNLVEAPGNCTFAATGDQTGVVISTYPAADRGCSTTLPDGTCVPTVAIDQTSPAADGGSCTAATVAVDAREQPRPFDLPALIDADDGCDVGAFEAVDADGDGFTEAADCAPDDPSVAPIDACGVCGGDGSLCSIFTDGFESGDTTAWSSVLP